MQHKVFTVDEVKKKMERYCTYRDRCHQEVENKLKEFRLIDLAREQIVLHLIQSDLLNEERFAKSFARGKFRIKKYGKQRIIRMLKEKGITAYNIKTALWEIDEEEYRVMAFSLAAKKERGISEENSFKKRKKITEYMMRKGYEYSVIQQALDHIIS